MSKDSIISLKNVCKAFSNNLVLNNINLNISKGDIYGVLGPNGAGKTTLMRTLVSLLKIDSGIIKIFNKTIDKDDNNLKQIKKRIGFLVQDPGIYKKMSGYEFLIFFARIYKVKNIDDKIFFLSNLLNLKNSIYNKLATYSKGMIQKINLARSLLNEPELIILDEPTANLDIETSFAIRNYLKEINTTKKTTIIISSHNLYEIQELCNKVAFIHNGAIVLNELLPKLNTFFNSTIYEITIPPEDIKKAKNILQKLKFLKFIRIKNNSITYSIKEKSNNFVLKKLIMNNIHITAINEDKNTLQTAYMEILKLQNKDHNYGLL